MKPTPPFPLPAFFRAALGALGVAVLCGSAAHADTAVFEEMGLDAERIERLEVIEEACTTATDMICAGTVKRLSDGTPGTTAALLERACEAGRMESCGALAYLSSKSFEVPLDDETSVALYTKACDAGHMPSCAGLGYMIGAGRGTEKDEAAGIALQEKACAADDGLGCNNLAVSYGDGAKALALLERACGLGNALACTNAGFAHYRNGDLRTAIDLIDEGCNIGRSAACRFFGIAYYTGDPFERDYETAALYAGRACITDDPWACHVEAQAVDALAVDIDPRYVRGLYMHACDLGREEACERADRHGLPSGYRWDEASIVFAPQDAEPVSLGNVYAVEDVTAIHADGVLVVGETAYYRGRALDAYDPANSRTEHDGKLVWGDFGAYFAGDPLEGVDPETFDPAGFEALDFPFSKDATRAWSGDDIVEGADVATFETLGWNHAKDASTYYFREANRADVPYEDAVTADPDCFGWATIDGAMYYRGGLQEEVDAESYRCIDFVLSLDRAGIYSYGNLKVPFDGDVDPAALRFLNSGFVTDGAVLLWIGGGPPYAIEGLDLATLEVLGRQEITDGTKTVFCAGPPSNPCRLR